MPDKTWSVRGYDHNPLGEVTALSLGSAMRKTRETRPDKLHGDRLFDVVATNIGETARDIIDLVRGRSSHR